VGVDTGGTFTDFVAVHEGGLVAHKRLSRADRPEGAVLEGLAHLGADRGTRVTHGSTVATNALLERKGARVVLVTTEGFEDVLEIGRQERPDLYALAPRRVEPLVPRSRRIGVRERTGPRGERGTPPATAALRSLARTVRAKRPRAIAVGLLHAYANPAHERRVERALAPLGVPITRSSALCPEIREFERFATTVANAYLVPRVSGYLRALARGTPAALDVVLSHGGLAPPSRAAREPARQLLSGPAAGLVAAHHAARACGFARALTLDVGGTSTDCAYVEGEVPRRRAREIAGFPILLPVLDVVAVGAGGGSIARATGGGRMLAVGPESAGAAPGPACYGRGGPATVTDALVALGRLPLDTLAGGALALDRPASHRVLASLARALRMGGGARAAAEGVVRAAEARMAEALRRVSVERGHDPRGAALVAFGGAGGLHACALAAALGCAAVVFPRHAGVLSALGALAAGPRRERSRTVLLDVRETRSLDAAFAMLERAVRAEFPARERRGVRFERWAEVRYAGQSHELSMRAEGDLGARFHAEHARAYGFADAARTIEVVTVEVRGVGPDRWAEVDRAARPSSRRAAPAPSRTVAVRHDGRLVRARVIDRSTLGRGAHVGGPAVVTESGATLWVPPGWNGTVHRSGAVIVRRGSAR
jgi:N-methylhydantoinase A